jgi:hypothetical protein
MAAIAYKLGIPMNKNSSRDCVKGSLRGARWSSSSEYAQLTHGNTRETSTPFFVPIALRFPRTTDAFFDAQRNTNFPCDSNCPPREPGKLGIDLREIKERYSKRATESFLPNRVERGVLYDA